MKVLMDLSSKFVVFLQFLLFCDISNTEMNPSKSYSLAKGCKTITFEDEYSRKLRLNINLTGALVTSHEDYLSDLFYNGVYPESFSCELVAEVPVGSKIMLLIESLHIPTDTSLCDDNYLYVFDYESSRSKAMVAAGGEKGLCGRNYPRYPIITTGPFITIVFNSRVKTNKIPHDAGFLFTLTEIIPTDKDSPCGTGRYRCGPVISSPKDFQSEKRASIAKLKWPIERGTSLRVTVARRTIPKVSKTSVVNYCIPMSLVCDGVKNCHDGLDEDTNTMEICSDMQKSGVINKFLSLGLSASIAIAVSCIIAITLCLGVTVCYCVRLCTSEPHHRQPQNNKDIGSGYQGMMTAPSTQGVNRDGFYSTNFVLQSSGFISTRENSSASSLETDKMYYMYQDPTSHGYMNITRPASEKIGHWGDSSLVSYPSKSECHHSHPETPYFMRDPYRNDHSPSHVELIYRPPQASARCHHNSYNHQTPTSSRSAKSTKSTKSSNIDKKNAQNKESKSVNSNSRKYPLSIEESKIIVLGPVLGQV